MKNFIFSFAVCILLCAPSYGQMSPMAPYLERISEAEALYNGKEYMKSAKAYSSAFELMGWKGRPKDRYNAARSWAMAKIPDSAFFCLQKMAEKTYYDDISQISKEEDFKILHKDKRWQPLLDLVSRNKDTKLPDGWGRAGDKPGSYFMGMDKGAGKEGNKVATIKSIDKLIDGFGTIMQSFTPEKYLGKRIKMTGYLKTKDVKDWAGFWLRVDGEKGENSLAFDNMKNGKTDRAVRGTTNWKQYEIVLDVSEKATNISFGALLSGTGQVWFDKIDFEIVSHSIPTTGEEDRFSAPRNLNFGK